MKKILILLLIISTSMVSCKTAKKASSFQPDDKNQTEAVASENATNEGSDEGSIVMKTEEVTLADGEDQSMAGYGYYVIIGGFSVYENAKKFKNELISKGFTPVMLKAANGYTRVAVGETNSEPEARKQVLNIRQKFPEHNDVWLLRNK